MSATESQPERWSGDKILTVSGKRFYCSECGSNVLKSHLTDTFRYRCNGCGAMYRGEGLEDNP